MLVVGFAEMCERYGGKLVRNGGVGCLVETERFSATMFARMAASMFAGIAMEEAWLEVKCGDDMYAFRVFGGSATATVRFGRDVENSERCVATVERGEGYAARVIVEGGKVYGVATVKLGLPAGPEEIRRAVEAAADAALKALDEALTGPGECF